MLRTMLNKAQIVADTFHGRWDEGISIREVKAVLDEINRLEKLPEYLLAKGITEPLAVGSARLRQDEPYRGLVMVVDIGAGTSDIALFGVVENPEKGLFNAFPVENGNKSLAVAGDTLDSALRSLILKSLNMMSADEYFQRDDLHLRMQLRNLKETLFRDGSCTITLTNGRTQIMLEDFLEEPMVQRFKQNIEDTFKDALSALSPNNAKRYADADLSVVLTGGGAMLPMIQGLNSGIDIVHGSQLHRVKVAMVPDMLLGNKELEAVYPQLAVAVGGSMPQLIDEKSYMPDISIPVGSAVLGRYQVAGV